MPVLAILACKHKHWPTGTPPKQGDLVFCDTCRALREVRTVGRTEW